MKKIIICGAFLFSAFVDIARAQTEQLYQFGKIWGFLKYFHPAPASGKTDMDSLLFKAYPRLIASDRQKFNGLCIEIIDNLDQIKSSGSKVLRDERNAFVENHDLKWMSDTSFLSPELVSRLTTVLEHRHQGRSWYIDSTFKIFSPANEKLYTENWKEFPQPEKRLLVLFRFWNMMEYFFPYKYMTDQNWDLVLRNSISAFNEAEDAYSYHLSLTMLISAIDDSHCIYFDDVVSRRQFPYIFPFELTSINDTAVVTAIFNDSLAKVNGIQKNDLIVSINNKSIKEVTNGLLSITGGSNFPTKLNKMLWLGYLIGDSIPDAMIGILNNGKVEYRKVNRYTSEHVTFKTRFQTAALDSKILPGNIFYCDLSGRTDAEIKKMMKLAINARAIILDLRKLPPVGINFLVSYFTQKPKHFAKVMTPDFSFPGYYKWSEFSTIEPQKRKNVFKGPVFVLVNETTQSQTEFTAMALAVCENVKIVGSQTSGADGNALNVQLPGTRTFQITFAGLFYPDESPAQRKGVKIDVEVKPTVKGITEGRDELIERAVLEAMKYN